MVASNIGAALSQKISTWNGDEIPLVVSNAADTSDPQWVRMPKQFVDPGLHLVDEGGVDVDGVD